MRQRVVLVLVDLYSRRRRQGAWTWRPVGGAAVAILLAAGLFAGLPSAAGVVLPERNGGVSDPDDDGPHPQRDLVWVEASSDPNEGRFWGYVELAAAPTRDSVAEYRVYYGRWKEGACHAEVRVSGRTATGANRTLATATTSATAEVSDAAQPLSPGTTRRGTSAAANAAKVRFTVQSAAARGTVLTCFWARLVEVGAQDEDPPSKVYDETGGEDLTPNDAPELWTSGTTTVRVPARRWRAVRVPVRNWGDSTARSVKAFVVKVPRGVRVRKRRVAVPKIRPDRSARARFVVWKKTAGTIRLKVRFTAARSKARIGHLAIQVAPKPPRHTRSLAGRYYWRTNITPGRGWDNDAVYFVNRRWAYRGRPTKGIPTCRRRTATATGDGCVRYWFNHRREVLQVDATRGRAIKGGVRIGRKAFVMRLLRPRPGARLRVRLVHVDSIMCPGPTCTVWSNSFETWRNGRYHLGGTQGRYRILNRGRIRLTSGGRSQVRTLMLMTDRRGRAAPGREGVFLGGVNYYR